MVLFISKYIPIRNVQTMCISHQVFCRFNIYAQFLRFGASSEHTIYTDVEQLCYSLESFFTELLSR